MVIGQVDSRFDMVIPATPKKVMGVFHSTEYVYTIHATVERWAAYIPTKAVTLCPRPCAILKIRYASALISTKPTDVIVDKTFEFVLFIWKL